MTSSKIFQVILSDYIHKYVYSILYQFHIISLLNKIASYMGIVINENLTEKLNKKKHLSCLYSSKTLLLFEIRRFKNNYYSMLSITIYVNIMATLNYKMDCSFQSKINKI